MKTETPTTADSISFASSSNQKYGGILRKSTSKLLRKEFSDLISYVYSVSPPFRTLHYVITFFRIAQIIGPSLFPGYLDFWKADSTANKFLFVFTILFYLIPPKVHEEAALPALIIYIVLVALILILLFVCAKMFKKNANLPNFIPPIISFFFSSFGFVLPPIAVELLASELSKYIFDTIKENEVIETIILFIISLILTILYLYIFLGIALQVLTFQPMSLMTVCTSPQNAIIVASVLINFLAGICEFAGTTVTMVFCFVVAICYFISALIPFYKGGLVRSHETQFYLGGTIAGCLMSIIMAVIQILKLDASMILIGIFFLLVVAFTIGSSFVLKKITSKRLHTLDIIMDEKNNFETKVKSVNSYINLVVTGFSELHPICLNWSFLKMGIERWPNNGDVWFIYAKFCAIYPEETQALAWIFRSIISNKVKGRAARTVKEQSLSVARQREINLSPDLKTKLNSASKHVTAAKQKLRNVWDMAIQGNILDMEIGTKRAIKAIKSCDGDLLHILRLFPNNRFVTRQYARFCKELLADYETHYDMIEKSRLLQRNLNVNKDQTHEYGIMAFPLLPDKLNGDKTVPLQNATTTAGELTNSEIDLDVENDNYNQDGSKHFKDKIENLRIPSITGMSIISLVLYFVLFVLPVVIIILIIPSYIDGLLDPLDHLYDISLSRTLMYQIIGFGLQTFGEKMGLLSLPQGTDKRHLPTNFGSTYETHKQLSYLCKQMTLVMEKIEQFRSYNKQNAHMDLARAELFQSTLNYTYFSKTTPTFKLINVASAFSDIVAQQRELITGNEIADDFVNTSAILNPSTSMTVIADKLNSALNLMILYITDNDNEQEKIIVYATIGVSVLSAVLFIVSDIVGNKWIQSNKEEAYRCLTSIPKNEVSQLAENLRIMKKESESSTCTQSNTENNKQEDNILKILMTGGTNGANSNDSLFISVFFLIMMVFQIVSLIILLLSMKEISYNLRCNSPHIDYLQGMYANLVAATTCVTSLIGFNFENTTISNVNKDNLLERIDLRLATTRDYYDQARYGGKSIDEPPFMAYRKYILDVDEKFKCEDPLQLTTDLRQASLCYTADDLIILTEGIYRSYIIPYQEDKLGHYLKLPNAENFRIVWDLLIYPVYDIFIYPMSEGIIETIEQGMKDIYQDKIIYIIIFIVIGLILEIAFLALMNSIKIHIKGVLRLLLHCQPKVIASSTKMLKILDGDFSKSKGEYGVRSAKFYEVVCDDFPDAMVVCNEENTIKMVNKSLSRIFGEKLVEKIMNQPITDFVSSSNFGGNVMNLMNCQPSKPIIENVTFNSAESGSQIYIEATSMKINECFVVILRDITQTIRYNTLIKEEKAKSDKLLGSILPASLVPRVQAGEKNISFAVQSATIVFMDIVSFTPWCGSLPAEKVMATLNNLFMKNDALVAKYPTMTKIKCIGDCYMAAGGVFAEINQPAVHAKEVVNFGLDALDAIADLDKELNESLQIRVGINTGGPIVAGVLGIGKPTFEILGPAINMAQQMEHHGVPSKVHVSRSVYELIYGDSYEIKERGQIEVKNGTVVTYLVDRKKK